MTRTRPITFLAGAAAVALGAANEGALGPILVDSKGRTLYLFRSDSGSKSTCLGACAGTWPPLRATGKPTVSGRGSASLIGTSTRSDGKHQVTYDDTRGQGLTDFGASWYVLTPAGQQVSGQASRSYGSTPSAAGSYSPGRRGRPLGSVIEEPRMLASSEGLAANAAYMADFEDEIAGPQVG